MAGSTGGGPAPLRRVVVALVLVGAVAWALAHRPSLSEVTDDPGQLALFGGALLGTNAIYFLGLGLAAAAVARAAGDAGGWRAWRRHTSMRRWGDDVLRRVEGDRLFRFGFGLNWGAAVVAALIPAVAVVTLLPTGTWTLLLISVVDVTAAVVLRVGVRRRLRRASEAGAQEADSVAEPQPRADPPAAPVG